MIRLHIVAEGQTEETFANNTLKEHFAAFEVYADVRCVETSRTRRRVYRGGLREYAKLKGDLSRWMRQDAHPEVWFTTMIDLYQLPRNFPEAHTIDRGLDPLRRVRRLERAFRRDLQHPRFIPYIQLHEFEALILSEPDRLVDQFPNRAREINALKEEVDGFPDPEAVNDGEHSAPSIRIINRIPEYDGRKPSAGPAIAASIGVQTLRMRCPHFGQWVRWIEYLGRCGTKRVGSSDVSGQ